jgi:hypothetical protein
VTVLPVPYIRTSSAANVGTDEVSDKRQRHAIAAYVTFYSHRDLLCMQIVQA